MFYLAAAICIYRGLRQHTLSPINHSVFRHVCVPAVGIYSQTHIIIMSTVQTRISLALLQSKAVAVLNSSLSTQLIHSQSVSLVQLSSKSNRERTAVSRRHTSPHIVATSRQPLIYKPQNRTIVKRKKKHTNRCD